jgi:predicted RNA-binding protein YlxR (DUF448 family)/ribosomal protein L30E
VQAVTEHHEDDAAESEGDMPERTCAGCRAIEARDELFRLAIIEGDDGVSLVPDLLAKLGGRHVSVHPRKECVDLAARRGGFSRALRREMRVDSAVLCVTMQGQVTRRVEGLLLAALRRRVLALGTDAVQVALRAGAAQLILVAKDAAGRRDDLLEESRKRQVPALELSDKAGLGRLTGRATLGVLAILDGQMAREVSVCARWLAGLSEDG